VIPLPEGGGGPSRFPGDLRRGPVHPARRDLESRVASRAEARRDLRRDRMWRRLRGRPKSNASGLSMNRSEERVSRAAPLASVEAGHVGALRGDPARGQAFSAGCASCVSGSPAEAGPGRDESPGVTAEAGRIRDVPRATGCSSSEAPVKLWFQRRASRRSARLKVSHKARAGGCANRCRRWEARRATGHVDATV